MHTTYWTVKNLAHYLGETYHTVQKWPARHYGPPYHTHLCNRILYKPAEVAAWKRSQMKVVA